MNAVEMFKAASDIHSRLEPRQADHQSQLDGDALATMSDEITIKGKI